MLCFRCLFQGRGCGTREKRQWLDTPNVTCSNQEQSGCVPQRQQHQGEDRGLISKVGCNDCIREVREGARRSKLSSLKKRIMSLWKRPWQETLELQFGGTYRLLVSKILQSLMKNTIRCFKDKMLCRHKLTHYKIHIQHILGICLCLNSHPSSALLILLQNRHPLALKYPEENSLQYWILLQANCVVSNCLIQKMEEKS